MINTYPSSFNFFHNRNFVVVIIATISPIMVFFHNRLIEVLLMRGLFKKNSNFVSINIEKETYHKLQIISEQEDKTFTEIINDCLKGKTIHL